MQTVQIYIYVDGVINRIELFKDEKISVTSSIQNFNDLGKLFTDYSQSFTIPASKHNNAIFKHWYESAVGETDLDGINLVEGTAFDHRIKYYGYIEIDTIPFRDGKFTMEKANKKNGFIESYSINFVGNLVQLKDKFLEDKIGSLPRLSELNLDYNLASVVATMNTTTPTDVYFPIIGNDKRYEYQTGDIVDDVTLLSGAINYEDLFPTIRVSKIFEYIQSQYGLNFTGEFLNSQTFSKLFLYCKNADKMIFRSNLTKVNFTSGSLTGLNLTTDILNVDYREISMPWIAIFNPSPPPPFTNPDSLFPDTAIFNLKVFTSSTNYNVHVYNNGVPYLTFLNLNGNSTNTFRTQGGFFSENFNFTFFINSDIGAVTFTTQLIATYTKLNNIGLTFGGYFRSQQTAFSASQTTNGQLNIASLVPDIKVSDFVTGLVKMFNMVIVPTAENTFEFTPLEKWYQDGDTIDITKYIQQNELEINKPKLFKRIDFKHEKSENILNIKYIEMNPPLEYGDLFFENPNSAFTENYEVKTPFEDVMWERTTGTDFLTATMWTKDLQPYVPKPVLMYDNGIETFEGASSNSIYFKNSSGANILSNKYRRFSNEIQLGATDLTYLQTLNWGVENSVWNLSFAPNGLYQQFYSQYINNLYNQRTRVIKAKGNFNPYLLSTLKLNDRVVVSNKRYIINTLTTDLTTGEVELELLNDFRDITQDTTYLRFSNIPFLQVDNIAQKVQFIIYKNNYDTFDVKTSTDFLTYTTSTDNDADILLDVTIPINTTAADRVDAIILEYFIEGVKTNIQIPVLQYA
jgi:hypothetical protein